MKRRLTHAAGWVVCLDLPCFFLASPFFLPGRFGPSLEKIIYFVRPRYPRAPASPLTCDVCYFLFSLPQLRCVLPTGVRLAPRFQCGGRDRGAAASLRRLWQTLRSRAWQALGTTELEQHLASRLCEDQAGKVCDRGSWPPASPFQCCVGKRAGLLPVKSCDLMLSSSASLYWRTGGWSLLHTPRSRF